MNMDLTDDGWRCVFQFLGLRDRVKAESVCRRWSDLMPYADMAALHFAALPFRPDRTTNLQYQDGELAITQKTVLSYWLRQALGGALERTGPYLRSVSFATAEQRLSLGPHSLTALAKEAPSLTHLNLSNCLLKVSCVPLLKELVNLEYLNLASVVYLEDSGPEASMVTDTSALKTQLESLVAEHENLSQLNLYNSPVAPRLNNSGLRRLQLSRIALDDLALEQLVKDCPYLESVCLSHCRRLANFRPLARLGGTLNRLWLSYTGILDADFALIVAACSRLEELRLDGCYRLEDLRPVKYLSRVRIFSISDNAQFTDVHLARLARGGRLERVGVPGCAVSDEGIRYLSQLCRENLRHLDVAGTGMGQLGGLFLASNCRRLKTLNVQSTRVGDDAISLMGESMPELEALYLQNCPEVTEEGFLGLLKNRLLLLQSGRGLAPLRVLCKAEGPVSPVSEALIDRLRAVAVLLSVQRPLLALPAPSD